MARKKDEQGVTIMDSYKYNYEIDTSNLNDLNAITKMGIEGLKNYNPHRPPKYADTPEGLDSFKNKTLDYLRYIDEVNSNDDMQKKVVLDIEGWCSYLQITRKTLHIYYHERGKEWSEFIDYFKTIITAYKKQLAFSNKTPSIFAIFDLVNGSAEDGFYRNTNSIEVRTNTTDNNTYYLPSERAEKLGLLGENITPPVLEEDSNAQESNLDIPDLPCFE